MRKSAQLTDTRRDAAVDMRDNVRTHGAIEFLDGSVLRLDPPLPFDPDKPLFLDGDTPIDRGALIFDRSGSVVVSKDNFLHLSLRGYEDEWLAIDRISNAPAFEVEFCRAYDANGNIVDTFRPDNLLSWLAANSDDDYMVQHWTRRPGEKYATPERVWPEGE